MKNQVKKIIISMFLSLTMLLSLVGCGEKKQDKMDITVKFYNGKTLLGEVKGKEGELISGYEAFEKQEGYEFNGWFETPSFLEKSRKDPAKDTFPMNTNLYGNFKSLNVAEDTRPWTIVGTGAGPALALSKWDNTCSDDIVTFKATGNATNEFALTTDLFAGDQFQVIHDYDWADQRGYGCFSGLDETCFENGGGLSGSAKSSNINVLKDGNYTITLVTDPENASQDVITIKRNGDPLGAPAESNTEPYVVGASSEVWVKGSWVADWSENKQFTRIDGTNTFKLTMELAEGTELYFMIWDNGADTGLGMKYSSVTENSKQFLTEADNVKVAAAGTYTFTVDLDAMTIDVAK